MTIWTPGASVAIKNNAFAAGTVTFTGLNGGVNFPSGAIVVVGFGNYQSGVTLTSPQIGGQAATIVAGTQDANKRQQLFIATMPASSPDTFSFTNGNAVDVVGVASGYFDSLSSATPNATGIETFGANSDPQHLAAAITVPSNGFGVVFCFTANGAANNAPTAMTWANATQDTFAAYGTGPSAAVGLAHTSTAGSWNPTATGVTHSMNFVAGMAAATWTAAAAAVTPLKRPARNLYFR
jgi:hypothetical protein